MSSPSLPTGREGEGSRVPCDPAVRRRRAFDRQTSCHGAVQTVPALTYNTLTPAESRLEAGKADAEPKSAEDLYAVGCWLRKLKLGITAIRLTYFREIITINKISAMHVASLLHRRNVIQITADCLRSLL